MTHRSDVARGREIIERWCVLAEQRLDYLTELFETGRWRRFHSEVAFLENIQEAKANVETWRMLLNQEASPDNSAVDTSWLVPRKTVPPRKPSMLRDELRPALPRSLQIVATGSRPAAPAAKQVLEAKVLEPKPLQVATSERAETAALAADTAALAEDNAWQQALDLTAMQQRYPLLRHNAL